MKIAVLATGGLGLSCISLLADKYELVFIATDKESREIIGLANAKSIPLFIGNPRNRKLYEFAGKFESDILFSINYLFIIEEDIFSKAKYTINFHGSLLPKYRGRTPHVWAIINGERETGVTAHLVDKDCDAGNIILQERLLIGDDDSGGDILNRYATIYPKMINSIIEMVEKGNVNSIAQDHTKATWFGKRTAEDGEINWSWFKERIRNWVRAQRYPYPGAFTFYNKTKIVIEKVIYSDYGFNEKDENGFVLFINPNPVIKTPNGTIELKEIRQGREIIKPGIVLGK